MSCCQMLGPKVVWGRECGLDLLPGKTSAVLAAGVAAAPNKSDSSTLPVQGPCPPCPVLIEVLGRLVWVMPAANFPRYLKLHEVSFYFASKCL